jgi:Protein of unknown function (DUF3037)
MTSWYSVIQYVPNPIAGELINIGVLVSDEQEVRVHFLQNWERVRCFGMSEDIDLLKNFAHKMQEATKEWLLFLGDRPSDLPVHERFVNLARGWMNGIQFTEPCGSQATVDQLLEDMTQTYLLEPLKVVKNEYQISRIYDVLNRILFSPEKPKKSTHKIKNRDPFSNLSESISRFGMTYFEKPHFPDIDDEDLKKNTEDLSYFDSFSLKIVELYLSRINKVFEKNTNDSWRAIPYVLSFVIFALLSILAMISSILKATIPIGIYPIAGSLFVSLIGFLVVMKYVKLSKNMKPSKIVLCLHILKEAQLIRLLD